jgi:hypothetical protein
MFNDPLYGVKLVVVEDRVEHLVLPRTRAKTASVRKAYNRLRRKTKVKRTLVHRFEDTAGAECMMAGNTAYVSPRGAAKLRQKVEDLNSHAAVKAEESPAAANSFSTKDLNAEKLLEILKKYRGEAKYALKEASFLRPPTSLLPPANVAEEPAFRSPLRYMRDSMYDIVLPKAPLLIASCF